MTDPVTEPNVNQIYSNINVLMLAWLVNFAVLWGLVAYFSVVPNLGILMIDLTFMVVGGFLLNRPKFLDLTGHPHIALQGIFTTIYLVGFMLTILLFYHLGYIAA